MQGCYGLVRAKGMYCLDQMNANARTMKWRMGKAISIHFSEIFHHAIIMQKGPLSIGLNYIFAMIQILLHTMRPALVCLFVHI